MAERKTDAQRLEEIETKLAQLAEQKKTLQARTNKKERAVRTHRLIQIGALSEKYFGCHSIEPVDYEVMLKQLVDIPDVKSLIKHPAVAYST